MAQDAQFDIQCSCGQYFRVEFQNKADADKWALTLNHGENKKHVWAAIPAVRKPVIQKNGSVVYERPWTY